MPPGVDPRRARASPRARLRRLLGLGPGPARGASSTSRRGSSPRAEPADVFAADPDELWRTVLHRKGGKFSLIATMPYDPGLN